MGLRFYRRLNLGRGLGVNVGLRGLSLSLRGRRGAVGTSGFSLRSGIPGLTYRGGRRGAGGTLAAVIALLALGVWSLGRLLGWVASKASGRSSLP